MSIFDIKKTNSWNYTDSAKPDYSLTLEGYVCGMDNPQAYDFRTKKPRYWDDGSPVRNIRLFVKQADGSEKSITFRPKSALFEAFANAGVESLTDLISYHVSIATEAGDYSVTNPRPWFVVVGAPVEGAQLHKVPVLDYDSVDAVTGEPK